MAPSDDLSDALKAIELIAELSQKLASEAEAQKAARRPADRLQISEWDEHDPLCTERAKMMSWYFETTGVLGLAQFIVDIAQCEADEEVRRNSTPSQDLSSQPQGASSGSQAIGVQGVSGSQDSQEDAIEDSGTSDQDTGDANAQMSSKKYAKSWDLILDDHKHNGCRKIIYYLSSLPAELLRALIRGNIQSRIEDQTFRQTVQPYVTPADRQGTYGVWVALARTQAQPASDVGKGLTMRQLKSEYNAMRIYIDVAHPESEKLAKKVDASFSGSVKRRSSLDYTSQRRYGSGSNDSEFDHHRQWLGFVDLYYLQWARKKVGTSKENLLDNPMQRCFVYVGLSNSVVSRITNHCKHSGTISKVLDLLTATLEYLYPDTFSVSKSSYQIFKTVSKENIGFDEELSMILTGVYSWDGGLNAAYAGRSRGGGPNDRSDTSLRNLQKSKSEIESSGLATMNVNNSLRKMAERDVHLDTVGRKQMLQRELLRKVQTADHEAKLLAKEAKLLVKEVKVKQASHEPALKSAEIDELLITDSD